MILQSSAARRACEAYYFHATLSMNVTVGEHYRAVRDDDNRNVWDFNRIFEVTASSDDEIDFMLETLAKAYQLQGYNYFSVSPFTPPIFSARLALDDYKELTPIVQMVLAGKIKVAPPAGFGMAAVISDGDWNKLYQLVRADHLEGGRTQGGDLDARVTRGIVEGYRRKRDSCQFFLTVIDDKICGYGSATTCPNGIGMIEDLFTSPSVRRRGVASALIAGCVEYLRQAGATEFLIGSLTSEPPKHLYHQLGFKPVCLTRSFYKKLTR